MLPLRRWPSTVLLALLVLFVTSVIAPPAPAAAQSVAPRDGYVILNEAGGETASDGLEVWVGPGAWNIKRNGKWQLYSYSVDGGGDPDTNGDGYSVGFLQVGLYDGEKIHSVDREWGDVSDETKSSYYEALALDSLPASGKTESAVAILTAALNVEYGIRTLVTTTYTAPNNYIDVEMTVLPPSLFTSPEPTPRNPSTVQLYVAGDWFLDGSDEGPGIETTDIDGRRLVAQYNDTAVGGFVEMAGSEWDSFFEGDYECALGWFVPPDVGCPEGPYDGSPYDNTIDPNPSVEEGVGTDAGIGAHWEVSATAPSTRSIRFYFDDVNNFLPPAVEQCQLTPDMAVNPQFIELLPNGTARVEVSLRNLCKDKPYNGSDLLLSVNDQLRVIDGSRGLTFLGSRAAVQGLSLNPDETRTYYFIVQAGDVVPAGPVHISELYNSGRVVQRIDGVFITPPPAPAAAPVVAPEVAAPAAPAAPAPLPAALPNTAGETTPLGVPFAVFAAAALIGLSAWRLTKGARRG